MKRFLYWLLAKLEKKPEINKEDYVDLTIGRVYFRIVTKGAVQRSDIQATIYKDVMNDALWMSLMELELVDLPFGQLNNLLLSDGDKVRDKLKEILQRHGLITEQEIEPTTGITAEEAAWLRQTEMQQKQVINDWVKKDGNNNNRK